MQDVTSTTAQQPVIDPILRPKGVAQHCGVSMTTIKRWRSEGILPEPLRISEGIVGWRLSTVEDVLEQLARKYATG